MDMKRAQNGDIVFAATNIVNDGSVPHAEPDQVFAKVGTPGMLVNTGHFEHDPSQELYLVCFENENGELGQPVTCLEHELSAEPVTVS